MADQLLVTEAPSSPVIVQMPPTSAMSDDEFFEFCQLNRDLRIERNAKGEIIIMPPAGGETGSRNFRLNSALGRWALQDQAGIFSIRRPVLTCPTAPLVHQ